MSSALAIQGYLEVIGQGNCTTMGTQNRLTMETIERIRYRMRGALSRKSMPIQFLSGNQKRLRDDVKSVIALSLLITCIPL